MARGLIRIAEFVGDRTAVVARIRSYGAALLHLPICQCLVIIYLLFSGIASTPSVLSVQLTERERAFAQEGQVAMGGAVRLRNTSLSLWQRNITPQISASLLKAALLMPRGVTGKIKNEEKWFVTKQSVCSRSKVYNYLLRSVRVDASYYGYCDDLVAVFVMETNR